MLISIVLLAFLSLGAVSAFDNSNDTIGNNIALDGSDEMLNADESNGNILASASYNKTIYVNYTGDDSGTGGQNSPYASLNKGISNVNASDNAVIYLSAGRFTGENNTDLSINLAHKNYNGSLTIIGASNGQTILDGNDIIYSYFIIVFGDALRRVFFCAKMPASHRCMGLSLLHPQRYSAPRCGIS